MATWMTHLRVSQIIYDAIDAPWLDPLYFAFGSVAPDCGIALPDGRYDPSKETTHYGHSDNRDYTRFAEENLIGFSDDKAYSFFLGYYLHIITDTAWVNVYRTQRLAFRSSFDTDALFNAVIKQEWDTLDFQYLHEQGAPRLLKELFDVSESPSISCRFIRQDALDFQFYRTVQKYRSCQSSDFTTNYLSTDALEKFIRDFCNVLLSDMTYNRTEVWMRWHEKVIQQ